MFAKKKLRVPRMSNPDSNKEANIDGDKRDSDFPNSSNDESKVKFNPTTQNREIADLLQGMAVDDHETTTEYIQSGQVSDLKYKKPSKNSRTSGEVTRNSQKADPKSCEANIDYKTLTETALDGEWARFNFNTHQTPSEAAQNTQETGQTYKRVEENCGYFDKNVQDADIHANFNHNRSPITEMRAFEADTTESKQKKNGNSTQVHTYSSKSTLYLSFENESSYKTCDDLPETVFSSVNSEKNHKKATNMNINEEYFPQNNNDNPNILSEEFSKSEKVADWFEEVSGSKYDSFQSKKESAAAENSFFQDSRFNFNLGQDSNIVRNQCDTKKVNTGQDPFPMVSLVEISDSCTRNESPSLCSDTEVFSDRNKNKHRDFHQIKTGELSVKSENTDFISYSHSNIDSPFLNIEDIQRKQKNPEFYSCSDKHSSELESSDTTAHHDFESQKISKTLHQIKNPSLISKTQIQNVSQYNLIEPKTSNNKKLNSVFRNNETLKIKTSLYPKENTGSKSYSANNDMKIHADVHHDKNFLQDESSGSVTPCAIPSHNSSAISLEKFKSRQDILINEASCDHLKNEDQNVKNQTFNRNHQINESPSHLLKYENDSTDSTSFDDNEKDYDLKKNKSNLTDKEGINIFTTHEKFDKHYNLINDTSNFSGKLRSNGSPTLQDTMSDIDSKIGTTTILNHSIHDNLICSDVSENFKKSEITESGISEILGSLDSPDREITQENILKTCKDEKLMQDRDYFESNQKLQEANQINHFKNAVNNSTSNNISNQKTHNNEEQGVLDINTPHKYSFTAQRETNNRVKDVLSNNLDCSSENQTSKKSFQFENSKESVKYFCDLVKEKNPCEINLEKNDTDNSTIDLKDNENFLQFNMIHDYSKKQSQKNILEPKDTEYFNDDPRKNYPFLDHSNNKVKGIQDNESPNHNSINNTFFKLSTPSLEKIHESPQKQFSADHLESSIESEFVQTPIDESSSVQLSNKRRSNMSNYSNLDRSAKMYYKNEISLNNLLDDSPKKMSTTHCNIEHKTRFYEKYLEICSELKEDVENIIKKFKELPLCSISIQSPLESVPQIHTSDLIIHISHIYKLLVDLKLKKVENHIDYRLFSMEKTARGILEKDYTNELLYIDEKIRLLDGISFKKPIKFTQPLKIYAHNKNKKGDSQNMTVQKYLITEKLLNIDRLNDISQKHIHMNPVKSFINSFESEDIKNEETTGIFQNLSLSHPGIHQELLKLDLKNSSIDKSKSKKSHQQCDSNFRHSEESYDRNRKQQCDLNIKKFEAGVHHEFENFSLTKQSPNYINPGYQQKSGEPVNKPLISHLNSINIEQKSQKFSNLDYKVEQNENNRAYTIDSIDQNNKQETHSFINQNAMHSDSKKHIPGQVHNTDHQKPLKNLFNTLVKKDTPVMGSIGFNFIEKSPKTLPANLPNQGTEQTQNQTLDIFRKTDNSSSNPFLVNISSVDSQEKNSSIDIFKLANDTSNITSHHFQNNFSLNSNVPQNLSGYSFIKTNTDGLNIQSSQNPLSKLNTSNSITPENSSSAFARLANKKKF